MQTSSQKSGGALGSLCPAGQACGLAHALHAPSAHTGAQRASSAPPRTCHRQVVMDPSSGGSTPTTQVQEQKNRVVRGCRARRTCTNSSRPARRSSTAGMPPLPCRSDACSSASSSPAPPESLPSTAKRRVGVRVMVKPGSVRCRCPDPLCHNRVFAPVSPPARNRTRCHCLKLVCQADPGNPLTDLVARAVLNPPATSLASWQAHVWEQVAGPVKRATICLDEPCA